MYLAVNNRKPNIEWLKQARGLFSSPNTKCGAKRSKPQYLLRGIKEPSHYPPYLCHPQSVAFGLIVTDWLSMPGGASGVCAGEGRKHCFLLKILLKLPSVFLWPFFATRDSGIVTSFLASLT